MAGQGRAITWEVYGDNVNARNIHWFLLVQAPFRVIPRDDLGRKHPRRKISKVRNHEFLPSEDDHNTLSDDYVFHILEVLTQHLPAFQTYRKEFPKYIEHCREKEMSNQSPYKVLDILNVKEKDGVGMDAILAYLHNHNTIIPKDGTERMTFGGDQLTNERAYSARDRMKNPRIVHRGEGLHLCMNLCQLIMQQFYENRSRIDENFGTLFQLKKKVKRRDLSHDTNHYDKAKDFIDDALDAHIVASALHIFGMNNIDGDPFDPNDRRANIAMLKDKARRILQEYVIGEGSNLSKVYRIPKGEERVNRMPRDYDGVNLYAKAFMRVSLLFRDIRDAYRMGDGNRLFRDFKFLLLHLFGSTHIKYRLLIWRMLAYDIVFLSEHERYAYRWNMSINISGNLRECIPNDHLVELCVKYVQRRIIGRFGANASYQEVRHLLRSHLRSTLLQSTVESYHAPDYRSSQDVKTMANVLAQNNNIIHIPAREHSNYRNLFLHVGPINAGKFDDWATSQMERAQREM